MYSMYVCMYVRIYVYVWLVSIIHQTINRVGEGITTIDGAIYVCICMARVYYTPNHK